LERDASGLRDAIRGRGVVVAGVRGHARLLSPLVSGSLERASNLAEAMEARGYGRAGRTTAPSAAWTWLDRVAIAGAVLLVIVGFLWL
jgi:energy-coupling factor transport system permease protein